jgi:calreticulin
MLPTVYLLPFLLGVSFCEVFFEEKFDGASLLDWKYPTKSSQAADLGKFDLSSGNFFADKDSNQGLRTTEDRKFYALTKKIPKSFTNKGKPLVFQFSVKHEQEIDCGGGYFKLLPADSDPDTFDGESKYFIMFGPDICGNRRVHFIINYNGKNHLWKKTPLPPADRLTHVYTMLLNSDQTYEVFIDGEQIAKGNLYDDWDITPPKKITDRNDKKPSDWVDLKEIDDPEDKKPENWVEGLPEKIVDPSAKKPENWDDNLDGEWKSPLIDNPEFRQKWQPKKIPNPAYKGPWKAQLIDNPEFKEIPDIYEFKDIGFVGIEIWQVKSGTIFDNILVTDDIKYAEKLAKETYEALKEAETKAKDEYVAKIGEKKNELEGPKDEEPISKSQEKKEPVENKKEPKNEL